MGLDRQTTDIIDRVETVNVKLKASLRTDNFL